MALVATPNGQYLYVVNHDVSQVVQFDVGTDGKLYAQATTNVVSNAGGSIIGSFPTSAAIDPSGRFLFVTFTFQNGFTVARPGPGGIAVFPITAATGALGAALVNTTVGTTAANPLPYFPIGFNPVGVFVNPQLNTAAGGFVYVVDQDRTAAGAAAGMLLVFNYTAAGALTPVAGPVQSAAGSNSRWRPVGLGVMGLQDVFFQMRLPFDSPEAQALSTKIQEEIYYYAMMATTELAEKNGAHASFPETRMAQGQFQFDLWDIKPADEARWDALRQRILKSGVRNSLVIAIAPTATIASIVGCYECIEPQISNLFKRETLSGEFLQVNRYLINELKARGMWTEEMRIRLKMSEGSVQNIDELPADLKLIYRTVWEVPMRSLIDMAAARNAFIDQSQSLNLFSESPNIGRLSSMYMYAWKQGLKTTYYLRSRPATKIAKTTVQKAAMSSSLPTAVEQLQAVAVPEPDQKPIDASAAIACSLENPESCEACQ